jgi:hypothetical protein
MMRRMINLAAAVSLAGGSQRHCSRQLRGCSHPLCGHPLQKGRISRGNARFAIPDGSKCVRLVVLEAVS